MQFTGKNLRLVRSAVELALSELENQTVTCPDIIEFARDLEIIEVRRIETQMLLDRIDKAIYRRKK